MAAPPHHDKRRACPLSNSLLQGFIKKGLAEFTPLLERIQRLDSAVISGSKLLTDIIRFRDLAAHIEYVSHNSYLQMIASFVFVCMTCIRNSADKPAYPKLTKVLPEKFARMADINFVVKATCYSNYYEHNMKKENSSIKNDVNMPDQTEYLESMWKDLKNLAAESSFSEYTFPQTHCNSCRQELKVLELDDKGFLDTVEKMLKKSVNYETDQWLYCQKLYELAAKDDEVRSRFATHQAVDYVLNDLTDIKKCNCPAKDDTKNQPDASTSAPTAVCAKCGNECSFCSSNDELVDEVTVGVGNLHSN